MLRVYFLKEEEPTRLLHALQDAQATLVQNDADHLTNLAQAYAAAYTYATAQAQAYATGVHARQAQLSPSTFASDKQRRQCQTLQPVFRKEYSRTDDCIQPSRRKCRRQRQWNIYTCKGKRREWT